MSLIVLTLNLLGEKQAWGVEDSSGEVANYVFVKAVINGLQYSVEKRNPNTRVFISCLFFNRFSPGETFCIYLNI